MSDDETPCPSPQPSNAEEDPPLPPQSPASRQHPGSSPEVGRDGTIHACRVAGCWCFRCRCRCRLRCRLLFQYLAPAVSPPQGPKLAPHLPGSTSTLCNTVGGEFSRGFVFLSSEISPNTGTNNDSFLCAETARFPPAALATRFSSHAATLAVRRELKDLAHLAPSPKP